ncbi:MAG: hypothetical protein ACT4QD_06905 [Acidobacteriota bacterium]
MAVRAKEGRVGNTKARGEHQPIRFLRSSLGPHAEPGSFFHSTFTITSGNDPVDCVVAEWASFAVVLEPTGFSVCDEKGQAPAIV